MQSLYRLLLATLLFRFSLCDDSVCHQCGAGSYAGPHAADCINQCSMSGCLACDVSTLHQFGVWGDNCTMSTCRRGYIQMIDATDTTVCVAMLEGRNTSRDAEYLPYFEWPPSVATEAHKLASRLIDNTGMKGEALCTTTPSRCQKDERSIPCSWPFDSYCVKCDELIPSVSTAVHFTTAEAKRVANNEDYEMTDLWLFNPEASIETSIRTVTPRDDRLQVMKHEGARNSQLWIRMVNSVRPSGVLPNDAVVRLYVRCQSTPVTLKFGRHTNKMKITNCGEWTQVVAPLGPNGFEITGTNGIAATASIDEISVITPLVPLYPGSEPSWCAAGMYMDNTNVCKPCTKRHACPALEGHQDSITCPTVTRSLPSSNTCICPRNSKAVPDGNSISCKNCNATEDCSRGYVRGTLVAWHEQPGDAPSKLKQLSCGPLSCCAVDQVGDVLCWGDNTPAPEPNLQVLYINRVSEATSVFGVGFFGYIPLGLFTSSYGIFTDSLYFTSTDLTVTVIVQKARYSGGTSYIFLGYEDPWIFRVKLRILQNSQEIEVSCEATGQYQTRFVSVCTQWEPHDKISFCLDPSAPSCVTSLATLADTYVGLSPRPISSNYRLGSSFVTKPWIFAHDAFPVQGLHVPAIAVAVSQQTNPLESDMSCALLEDGTAKCWGWFKISAIDDRLEMITHFCNMGVEDGTDDPLCGFSHPTQTATSLRVSTGTACVATEAGEIWCWGRDLWTGVGPSEVPRPPRRWDDLLELIPTDKTSTSLVDFALAERFICAMYTVSTTRPNVVCAGRSTANVFTFAGITTTDKLQAEDRRTATGTPVLRSRLFGYTTTAIVAAGNSFCQTWQPGAYVRCYGILPESGAIYGNPQAARVLVYEAHPTDFGVEWVLGYSSGPAAQGYAVESLTLGASSEKGFGCATQKHETTGEKQTLCFGEFTHGRRMIPSAIIGMGSANEIAALETAKQITLGDKHGCAELENGDVVCWGYGANGRLGNTTCSDVGSESGDTPVLVGGLRLRSLKQPSRTWVLGGGAVAFRDFLTTEPWNTWKLQHQAYISHPLALTQMSHGSYLNNNTDAHWVQVYVYASCGDNEGNTACTLVLARNLHNATVLDADDTFHVEKINPGDSKQVSSVVWAYHGDSISVISYAANTILEVMSVSAFEDQDSCAYRCPVTHHMRNRDCVECRKIGCSASQYTAACNGGGLTVLTPVCLECDAAPPSATYVEKQGTQCYWQCDEGFFRQKIDGEDKCIVTNQIMCAVGSYLTPSRDYKDAECTPCTTDTPSDTNRVFVTDGANVDNCEEQCTTGNFLPSTQHTCASCNPSRCNRDGQFSYNSVKQCTRNQSAQCFPCMDSLAKSPGTIFTGPGENSCMYECAAGKHSLPQCGVWDLQSKDTTVLVHNMSGFEWQNVESSYAIDLYNNVIKDSDSVVDIVIRMRGTIRLSAYNHNSNAKIKYTTQVGDQILVETLLQTYTPRVSVQNHIEVSDSIHLDWTVNTSDMQGSTSIGVYIQVAFTTVTVEGLSLEVQKREQCANEPYSCIDCAQTQLPANSSFIRSYNCEWECDFDYERRDDNTCMFCPPTPCPVGDYMVDCGQCMPCVKTDALTIFTSTGSIRGLNTSCDTICPMDHFTHPEEKNCAECKSNITCPFSMYRKPCTEFRDMHCMGCKMCEAGSYLTIPCNINTDTVCEQCTSNRSATKGLPEHATWNPATYSSDLNQECEWTCNPGYIEDKIRKICKVCTHTCGSGQYISDCTEETGWEGCSPCVKPPNSTFVGTGRTTPNSCPWECNEGLEIRDYECVEVYLGAPPPPPPPLCSLDPGDCEPGNYLDTPSAPPVSQGNTSNTPCTCKPCAPPPNASIATFVRRGNCDWVCNHPYIRTNLVCERLSDITKRPRGTLLTSIEDEPTDSVIKNNTNPQMYIEPVTGWRITRSELGSSIDPTVILSGMIPFFTVLVVAIAMGCGCDLSHWRRVHVSRKNLS